MDLAASDLEKTSAIKREAMVSKLHNMQWLKNTSHSTSPVKAKILYKQRRSHDEDDKVEDKTIEDSKVNLSEESCDHHLTMDTCVKDLSTDPMAKSNTNLWKKDTDTPDMLLNAHALIMQKVEEEEISSKPIQENLVTTQLEEQCHADKELKDQKNMLQSILKDEMQNVTCPNFSELQNIDHYIKEPDLIENADKNNNAKPIVLDVSKESTPEPSENTKTSMEMKNKDACIKKSTTALKTNVKNASNATLSKCCNEKPFSVNSKRSLSNLSKSPSTDKYGKPERVNNKHVFTKKHSCMKDEQHNVPTKGVENKTKDIVPKLVLSKTNIEKESDKSTDVSQSDQKVQGTSPCTSSSSKDKTLQIQQRVTTKPFTTKFKGQEFSRSNPSSAHNRTIDKNRVPEKATYTSKNCNSSSRESEKKNGDKNFSSDQKPYIANNMVVAHCKNSNLSKPMKTKNMSGNVGHSATYGRNPLYARNNTTPDKELVGNAEYTTVTKVKRDCPPPTDTLPNTNIRTDGLCASNLEADTQQQQQFEGDRDMQLANTSLANIHETSTSICNNEDNANFTEGKKPANNEDCAEQIAVTSEQSCKNEKAVDNVRTVASQQPTDVNNKANYEEVKPSKDSFGLHLNKSYTVSQTYPISQHVFKPEDTQQQTQDANRMKNNQIIWNDMSDPMQQKSAMIVGLQSVQNMHSQQTVMQTENHMRQMSLREMDSERFYEQRVPMNDTTRLSQISNVFDAASYEYNVQAVPSNSDSTSTPMFDAMSDSRENSSMPHRYAPNVQQRPYTPLSDFTGHSVPVGHISRWNLSLQDGFHVEQFANTTQPATMHVYNAATFGPDDFSSVQVPTTNCLPPHNSLLYAPTCMQSWNSQLHYPTPVFHNPPCTNYTMLPNHAAAGQPNNYNDGSVAPVSVCMHEQPQHRYIHYVPGNSAMQMHANSNYMKGIYGCDLNNCTVETRTATADDAPMKSNRYYKKYPDNYRTAYDVLQYAAPASHSIPRPQQQQQQQRQQPPPSHAFVPAAVNQYNVYGPPGSKYYKQNMNFTQPPPKSPKDQKTQDFVCEDNSLEDIPPIISPKEFMTNNVNLPNKNDQFPPRMFKPDLKIRANTGYRQPSFQRYNSGFRRNVAYNQNYPREYASPNGVGRGITKTNQNTKI
ncbi:uncharacterized protein LOC105186134 isoform X2 [Harpegnathos saltator]|nr:uncharacterized protein LOC105186134 isoform X2 [Harpegnathos saltator]